jgi:alkylhydroperoxidase family enzyme
MVPNLLNLPFSVLGIAGAPADVVGMSMYVASRSAQCPYCSAHTCSFALRRGTSPEKLARALVTDGGPFNRGELATIAVARSLACIPCELAGAERDELTSVYGPKDAEWIVLGAAMMGFLNKFMDAIGVELEQAVVAEVRTTMGRDWSPGKAGAALDPRAATKPPPPADILLRKLRIVPLLPAAVRADARWQRGVPSAWPAVGDFLRERTGHEFPVLSRLHHRRAVRSVASMLRENLNPASTVIGLDTKILAGAVFAEIVADATLAGDIRAMASKHAVTDSQIDAATRFASTDGDALADEITRLRAALTLSRAASPSPARIDSDVVATCRHGGLSAPAIVELICWLSVLQMLHRLSCFYPRP